MKRAALGVGLGLGLTLGLGLGAGFGLAGCSDPDPRLVQMKKVRDQVCTCVDGPCIERAMKGMPKTRPDDLKEAERLGREILECIDEHPRAEPATETAEPAPAPTAPTTAPTAPAPAPR
jgi:hypothetical protein